MSTNTHDLHILPKLETKNQQASETRPSTLRTYAELGVFTSSRNLPQAPTGAGCCDAGQGGLVCEAGCCESEGVKV